MKTSQPQADYYRSKKADILKIIEASSHTEHGKDISIMKFAVDTYEDFCSIPFSDGEELAEKPFRFVNGPKEQYSLKQTSGTTGKSKKIYHDPETRVITYPQNVQDIIMSSHDPVLLHGSAEAMTYWLLDNTFSKLFPNVRILRYDDIASASQLIQEGDLLYITEYVSAIKRLFYSLGQMVDAGTVKKDQLKKTHVVIELSGDAMSLNELNECWITAQELFGVEPRIVLTYGMTELGGIGIYSYNPDDKSIRYKIKDEKFVEVVDQETGAPLQKGIGEIAVTQLRWTQGTILLRYRTGDLGSLIVANDAMYLELIGRNPSKGLISLQQCKVSVPGVMRQVYEKYKIPMNAIFQVIDGEHGSFSTLSVSVYSPAFVDKTAGRQVGEYFKEVIINDGTLDWDVTNGYIKFDIKSHYDASLDQVQKNWKILEKKEA
jgi:hypothetical protein